MKIFLFLSFQVSDPPEKYDERHKLSGIMIQTPKNQ